MSTREFQKIREVKWANVDGHKHGVIIEDIRSLLQREWEVKLVHVFREGNLCADYLAKLGTRRKSSYLGFPFAGSSIAINE